MLDLSRVQAATTPGHPQGVRHERRLGNRDGAELARPVTALQTTGTSKALITHDIDHASVGCDRFVVMSHGQVVFEADKKNISIEELTDHVIRT